MEKEADGQLFVQIKLLRQLGMVIQCRKPTSLLDDPGYLA